MLSLGSGRVHYWSRGWVSRSRLDSGLWLGLGVWVRSGLKVRVRSWGEVQDQGSMLGLRG